MFNPLTRPADETDRVLVPKDGDGNMTTDASDIYFIPTFDSLTYKSWQEGAGAMYARALKSCWEAQDKGDQQAQAAAYFEED